MTKQKTVIIHYYDGSSESYPVTDVNWPGPTPNFVRGFVEVDDGVFLNANDIKRIEEKTT